MAKQQPWTVLGINVLELYFGLLVFYLSIFLFSDTNGTISIAWGLVLFCVPAGLALLRQILVKSDNIVVANLMYVWDVGRLKFFLSSPSGAASVSFRYLLLFTVLTALLYFLDGVNIRGPVLDGRSVISELPVFTLAIVIIGAIYLFICNGADKGHSFLGRIFPIVIVEATATSLLLMLVVIVCGFSGIFSLAPELMVFLTFLWPIWVIWRSGSHLKEVVSRAT